MTYFDGAYLKTAALLPTPGDPLLARYWVNNYDYWADEVDELVVLVNGDAAAVPIYQEAGARVIHVSQRQGHGGAMRQLLSCTDADLVMFCEDDAFVRHRSSVWFAFDEIVSGSVEVVGCPRGGMDPAIAVAAEEKWGRIVGPDGSSGHGLWPAFLFGWADIFRSTSQRFESTTWQTGERVPGLDYKVPRSMTTDTMSAVAFELRAQYRIGLTVNYKEMDQKVYPGDDIDPPWFHAGGLSNDPHSIREGIPPESNEGRDWAHRFWWWRRIGHDYDPKGQDVDYWTPIIEPWINWDE